jgi:CRISPR/Cas system-associated endoribonuclease Cas2
MSLRRTKDIADDIDEMRRKLEKLLRKGIDKLQNSYIRIVDKDAINFTKETATMNDPAKRIVPTKDTIAFANESVANEKCSHFYLGSNPGNPGDCTITMGFWEVFSS